MFDPVYPSDLSSMPGVRTASFLRAALTKSLRTLEHDGLIKRTSHPEPHRAAACSEPMTAACSWAEEHWEEVLDACDASTHG